MTDHINYIWLQATTEVSVRFSLMTYEPFRL
jgi:hypothetical protein